MSSKQSAVGSNRSSIVDRQWSVASQLRHIVTIYVKLQLLHLRTHLEYGADFLIGIAGVALTHGAGFVFVWTVFQQVPHVAGWTFWEIAFLYALSILPRGLVELLCDGQWNLRKLVNRGEFDRLLVRPISPALQLVTQFSSIHGFGSVLLGGYILLRALGVLNLAWGVGHNALLLATVAGAVVLIGAINFASNCIAFWDPAANSAFPFLIANSLEFVKFPLSLYGWLVQILITWVLPFAFISYYPGLVLLGKSGASPWLGYLAPLAGPVMALLTSRIWGWGIQRYQGVGH